MSRAEAYAEAAIRGALEDLRGTAEGGRHNATLHAAIRLGNFVGAGVLDAADAEGLLLDAALSTGLPREEAGPAIRWGLDKGQSTPATLPTEDGEPPRASSSVGRWTPPPPKPREEPPPAPVGEPPPPPPPVEGLDAWRLRGTRLRSVRDRDGEPLDLGWRGLLSTFSRPTVLDSVADKGALPAWTAGVYRGGSGPHDLRGGVELLEASAVVLDLDAREGPPPKGATEEAVLDYTLRRGERLPPGRVERLLAEVLPGVAWAAHPTASSTPSAWRWRLVLPLAEPLPGGAYTVVVDALREAFLASSAPRALEADEAHNRQPTGLSYRPATTAAAEAHYRVLSAEGGLLSWRALLDGYAEPLALEGTSEDPAYVSALGALLEARCKVRRQAAAREARRRDARLAAVEARGFVRPSPEWFTEEPPPREYLLHVPDPGGPEGRGAGLLARGIPAILSAGGGSGKTFALVGLALAIVTRSPWLGRYPVGAGTIGRCALLLGEEPLEEVRRRLHTQARALGLSLSRLEERLLILPGAGAGDLALTQAQDGGRPAHTEWAEDLYAYLEAEAAPGWDAIILDPLSHFAGPDTEKDNAAATRLMQVLTRFTRLPGGPVVLMAHHERKPGKEDGGEASASSASVRGASAIVDNARWVARLHSELGGVPYGVEALGLARLRVTKSNYAPPNDNRDGDLLLRVEGGALRAPTLAEAGRFSTAGAPPLEGMTVPTKTVGERQRARIAKLERDYALARERAEGDAERLAKLEREYALKRAHAEEEHRNDKAAAERRRPKS